MKVKGTYALKVGKGYASDRLKIVNECYNPLSLKFLEDIDLNGKTVLEVACGIGLFACELAKLVGTKGSVVAIDKSPEQLEIAKQNAKEQNLNNIEFARYSVFELDNLNTKFDCVYSRFLLIHLSDPISALKLELNCVKPGGYLICSEPPFAHKTLHCYPKLRAFDRIKELHNAQIKVQKTDFEIGFKLPNILSNLGALLVYSYIGQPILDSPRKKSQIRLGLYEMSKHYLSECIFTKDELDQLEKDLKHLEQNNYIIGHVSCMETCVKKNGQNNNLEFITKV